MEGYLFLLKVARLSISRVLSSVRFGTRLLCIHRQRMANHLSSRTIADMIKRFL